VFMCNTNVIQVQSDIRNEGIRWQVIFEFPISGIYFYLIRSFFRRDHVNVPILHLIQSVQSTSECPRFGHVSWPCCCITFTEVRHNLSESRNKIP